MTRDEMDDGAPSDEALTAAARAGDRDAFAELWRRHSRAGGVAARQYAAIADADDLLAEAYTRIFAALVRGGGPHGAFRPYLYRTIRNVALDSRRPAEVPLDEAPDADLLLPGPELAAAERTIAFRAFRSLPARWQSVLWYLEVEGMSPSEVAPIVGLAPNAVSALGVRAREGLKKAWLQAHIAETSVPDGCRWTTERMGEYSRGGLSGRARERFARHLTTCERCTGLLEEVGDASGRLAVLLLPIFLGGSAAATILGGRSADSAGASNAGGGPADPATVARLAGRPRGPVLLAAGAAVGVTVVAATIAFAATATGPAPDDRPVAVSPTESPEPTPTPTPEPTPPPTPEPTDPPVTPPRVTQPPPPVVPPPVAVAPGPPTAPAIDQDFVTDRIAVTGAGDVPGATIEVWGTTTSVVTNVTSPPTLLASTVVAPDGTWATPEAAGLTPIRVTVFVKQVRDGLSSAPVQLITDSMFPAHATSTAGTVVGGDATWELVGWAGAAWVIREVGNGPVVASGTIGPDGEAEASVPLPTVPSGTVLAYEYGYVQDGVPLLSAPGLTVVSP